MRDQTLTSAKGWIRQLESGVAFAFMTQPGSDPAATRVGVDVLGVMGAAAPLGPGRVLGGYLVLEELGRGGMGVVYRARHEHLDRTVALKVLAPAMSGDQAFRDRFLRESRLAASLDHPAVVTIFGAGDEGGVLYLAMRFIDGRDLAEVLRAGPLEPERAVAVVEQVASALDAAHEAGLVHRDVKPANILTAGERCWLTDFGLAKRSAGQTALTGVGQMVGTVDYLAPEQIEGSAVDGRVDVYALGCVLFHALTGATPYPRDSDVQTVFAHVQQPPPLASAVREGLPQDFDRVIVRALAKSPADRFQTCGELAEAARAALAAARERPSVASGPVVLAASSAAARALAGATLRNLGLGVSEIDAEGDVVQRVADTAAPLVVLEAASGLADTCRRLKAQPAPPRIIALGPRAAAAALQEARDAGADETLGVPFSALQFQVAVGELLERSR